MSSVKLLLQLSRISRCHGRQLTRSIRTLTSPSQTLQDRLSPAVASLSQKSEKMVTLNADTTRCQTQHRFMSVTPDQEHTSSHYEKWTDLTYEDLVALLDSGDIQLFDVREPKEITGTGTLPSSVNIPLGNIKEALHMEDHRFLEHYGVDKPQKHDTNLVFYGLGHIKSTAALEIAHKLGFKKARHYVGGYEEWIKKQQRVR